MVTNGIRNTGGDRIDADQFHNVLHSGTAYTDQLLAAVRSLKDAWIPPGHVAAATEHLLVPAEAPTGSTLDANVGVLRVKIDK